jgi:tetratricopeptide (TPR) repeat protein
VWVAVLLGCAIPAVAQQAPAADAGPAADIQRAEQALQAKDFYLAESEYRFAAARALIAFGNLAAAGARWDEALRAYGEASQQLSDPTEPVLSAATVYLQQQKPVQAEGVLRELNATVRNPRVLQLLAVAYAAQNRIGEAMQQIDETRAAAPDDPEVMLAQANIALQAKDASRAQAAFDALAKARPGAAVHVLIGRTWRDYEHFDEARKELEIALRLDPRVRRANYYLGTILIRRPDALRDAIVAFQRELAIAPHDYLCNLNAGIALTADRRAAEAVPYLERAVRLAPQESRPLYHLGQAQFQADDHAGALRSFTDFLARASNDPQAVANVSSAEYVLGQALHALGRDTEATAHFDRAKTLKEKYRAQSQDQLEQYLAESPMGGSGTVGVWQVPAAPMPAGAAAARAQLSEIIARAYFNLGVILSQRKHYVGAAASFYHAADWDPNFPAVQASLGVARFQAAQPALAVEPLRAALRLQPNDRQLARLLALSCFQSGAYQCAAELLEHDADARSDASLQYALGVSLVKLGDTKRAGEIFGHMLAANRTSAPLYVMLGDAHAQQGDFDSALTQYQEALKLDANVSGAHFSSGVVYLRRGQLPLAQRHFEEELRSHPNDPRTRYHLAYTLSLQSQGAAAVPLLQQVLRQDPSYADARYLLGQILLEQGDAAGAAEQLEASIRLAPNEARAHYQLGKAYQRLGRTADAEQQFALFQQLKGRGEDQ